jgi:hypothetical protein
LEEKDHVLNDEPWHVIAYDRHGCDSKDYGNNQAIPVIVYPYGKGKSKHISGQPLY